MKKLSWLIGAAFALPLALSAQTFSLSQKIAEKVLHSAWTDGSEFVKYIPPTESEVMGVPNPSVKDKRLLFFVGGSMHEGGTHVCLEQKGNDFVITDRLTDRYQWFPIGCKVSCSERADYALVRDPRSDGICGVLKPMASSKELGQLIRNDLRTFALAGKYIDVQGQPCYFSENENRVVGKYFTTSHYLFGEEYDTPSLYLIFPDKTYRAERSHHWLILKPVKKNACDGYVPVPGVPDITLRRVFAPNEYEFPLTSERVLTASEIMLYAGCSSISSRREERAGSMLAVVEAMEVMLNEVYARHHYDFKDTKWKKYFNTKTWYKAENAEVLDRMSETERVNVEHIRFLADKLRKEAESIR